MSNAYSSNSESPFSQHAGRSKGFKLPESGQLNCSLNSCSYHVNHEEITVIGVCYWAEIEPPSYLQKLRGARLEPNTRLKLPFVG